MPIEIHQLTLCSRLYYFITKHDSGQAQNKAGIKFVFGSFRTERAVWALCFGGPKSGLSSIRTSDAATTEDAECVLCGAITECGDKHHPIDTLRVPLNVNFPITSGHKK